MEGYAFVFPILPGKSEEAQAFGKEISGPRADEMRASRDRLGATRETVWLHSTPMGDFGIVLIEGEDVAEANRGLDRPIRRVVQGNRSGLQRCRLRTPDPRDVPGPLRPSQLTLLHPYRTFRPATASRCGRRA